MVFSAVRFLALVVAMVGFAQASAVPEARAISLPQDIQDMFGISSTRLSNQVHCTSEKDCKDPSLPRCITFEAGGIKFGQCHVGNIEGFFCDDDGDCSGSGSNLKCMPQSSKCKYSTVNVKSKCCVAGGSGASAGPTSDGSSVTTIAPSDGSSGSNNAKNPSKDDGCVDERWLTARGYASGDFVHSSRVVKGVLCPTGLSLPCGTQHHAVEYAGKTTSYAELCSGGRVVCTTSRMAVNSLWSFHDHSQAGIEIDGSRGTRLFMHDVRYSYAQQYALHSVMSAVRIVSGAVKGAMTRV
jgi:hypothetical protein